MDREKIIKYWNKNRRLIDERYTEFNNTDSNRILKELIFCMLTPMSQPEKALSCTMAYNWRDIFVYGTEEAIANHIKGKVRFHNRKAQYIYHMMLTFPMHAIRKMVRNRENIDKVRDYLIRNIKGMSYKEASHFLRNCGAIRLAILDRYVLRSLHELRIIDSDKYPKNKEEYLKIEKKYLEFAKELKIPGGKLDLVLFGIRTGRIVK